MFRKLLVPLDGSLIAENALHIATDVALRFSSELMLLHVVEDVTVPSPVSAQSASRPQLITKLENNYRTEAARYLHDVKQRILADGLPVESAVVEGNVADQIIRAAQKEADLIVMTPHAETGMARWLLGSVTQKVLGHAPCPVLIVKDKRPLTNFLVPLDGSALSETAVMPTIELAKAFDAKMTCLKIIEPPVDVGNALVARLGMLDDEVEQWLKERNMTHAREYMESVAKRYTSQADISLNMVMKKSQPVEGILDYADQTKTDLIVMSTHGRSGVAKWLLGSVTERVVKKAQCHILVIQPRL